MKGRLLFIILALFLAGCGALSSVQKTVTPVLPNLAATIKAVIPTTNIPSFDHILVILFENRSYDQVIGDQSLPTFNALAGQNVLLTDYHAVRHPSLPNYIALTGGDTFGITTDCTTCFVNATSLPDLIEASGRSWKTYQEDLPSPCFVGSSGNYAQRHDPFIYFDPIRDNAARCKRSVVPFTELAADLQAQKLPDFAFIVPNLCNSGHDCNLVVADGWLKALVGSLQGSPALGNKSLIFITFDEASSDNSSCCGLSQSAGGRVAAILISPQAKSSFQDATPYSHYSLLKTILQAWKLPDLGFTANKETQPITAPWK